MGRVGRIQVRGGKEDGEAEREGIGRATTAIPASVLESNGGLAPLESRSSPLT